MCYIQINNENKLDVAADTLQLSTSTSSVVEVVKEWSEYNKPLLIVFKDYEKAFN